MIYDVIIIGMGPAGMAAALNLRRTNRSVMMFEKESVGGQIASSPRVENLPSYKVISGVDFINMFFDQILDMNISYELEEVVGIKKEKDIFTVTTNFKNREYQSRSVIIANGVAHKRLGLESETRLLGKGISFCAVCDGAFYENEDICIIGDANTALQYALYMSTISSKIYLYTLFDKFFADQILIDRVLKEPKIVVKHNLSTKEFVGQDKLEKIIFTDTKTKKDEEINVKGAFVCIGQIPSNEPFKDYVDLNKGFILVNDKFETKTPGLYAIGDCTDKKFRQVTTAISDGAVCAINCNDYLK